MFLSSTLMAGRAVDDDFWYGPVGTATAAGVSVSPSSSMSSSVVYRCVNLLAGTIAKLPVKLRELETKRDVRDDPVFRVLARRPNRWQTPYLFRAMAMTHLLLRGNAYAEMVFDRAGRLVELVPLHPDAVTVEELPSGDWRYSVRQKSGSARPLHREQVLHLVGHGESLPYGVSPIAAQREAIGAALAAQKYAATVFRNSARPGGGVIEMPGKFRDATARREWVEEYHRGMTGANAHRTPVFEDGMTYRELGMTNADAQMIETRKYSDTDLCRIFGVPPHKVGVMDRATYSNMEQQNVEWYEEVAAWGTSLEQQLQMQMLTEEEEARIYVQFELKGVLRADSTTRAGFYSKGIQDGWMTRNEVREREDMEPIDGLDEPLEPLNMARSSERAAPISSDRQQAVMRSAAVRAVTRELNALERIIARGLGPECVKRVVEFYADHKTFLMRALACDESAAQAWCAARCAELNGGVLSEVLAQWKDDGADALWELMQ